MALQSDSQGFLTGDTVTDIRRANDTLRQIRTDIFDIKRAMLSTSANDRESVNARNSSSGSNVRVNGPRNSTATPTGTVGGNPSPALTGLPFINPSEVATPGGRGRDSASGGFVGNQQAERPSAARDRDGRFSSNGEGDNQAQRGMLSGFADRITSAVTATTAGAEEADPTIKAFKEVAEPLARGYEIFSGGGDKKERWYRKIFRELNLFRKDESAFNRAANRSLHNIEGNPGGGNGSGSSGAFGALLLLLGNLLLKIPVLGTAIAGFTAVLSKIPLLKNLLPGRLSTNIPPVSSEAIPPASGTGGIGRRLLRGGKGLFKRIPLLGALIGGVSAASDIYGAENDDGLTRGEKDKADGKAVGGLAGSVGGMMAGAKLGAMAGAFGGPIGAAIGGVVGGAAGMFFGDQAGQIIGEKMGEWTTQLREADIPGKIIGAWDATTSAIKSGWDGALKLFSDAWGKAKDLGNAANDFVKDKTGIDVKAEVKNAYDDVVKYTEDTVIPSLVDLKNKGADAVSKGAAWIGENTTVGKGAKAISGKLKDRWNEAKQYLGDAAQKADIDPGILAKITNFESGFNSEAMPKRKDGSVISSAHGYGQFLDGTWKDMLNKHGSKYGVKNAGKLSDAEAEGLRSDKALQANMLAEFTKENIEKGRKLGGSNDDANVYALHNLGPAGGQEFLKALKNNPNAPVSSVKGMTKGIISGNKSLYGDGTGTVQEAYDKMGAAMSKGDMFAQDIETKSASNASASISNDLTQNKAPEAFGVASDTFAKANNPDPYRSLNSFVSGPGNAAQVQVASAPPIKPPVFAPPPPIPEAPPIIEPLASNSSRNMTVSMPAPDVGQDVKDRGIAHIVTGGYSSRG